jgi:hypothetical protein
MNRAAGGRLDAYAHAAMRSEAVVLLTAVLAIAGCADQGKTPTEPAGPPDSSATFFEVERRVLTPRCALPGCHAAPTPQTGLDLDFDVAYANLVGVSCRQDPPVLRVEPGNPARSYLVWKITGRAPIGVRMPLNAPPLSEQDITLIEHWIARGAPND